MNMSVWDELVQDLKCFVGWHVWKPSLGEAFNCEINCCGHCAKIRIIRAENDA